MEMREAAAEFFSSYLRLRKEKGGEKTVDQSF